ncbi:hypothetical protein M0804_007949 [Polistes exclamans]|nr:hypothetical protein M0804_007949 [Polistes exclamans]
MNDVGTEKRLMGLCIIDSGSSVVSGVIAKGSTRGRRTDLFPFDVLKKRLSFLPTKKKFHIPSFKTYDYLHSEEYEKARGRGNMVTACDELERKRTENVGVRFIEFGCAVLRGQARYGYYSQRLMVSHNPLSASLPLLPQNVTIQYCGTILPSEITKALTEIAIPF